MTAAKSLLESVSDSFDARRRNRVRLLSELTPRLQAARRVELELDRHLARRFNVFKYLRTDELGLSRIIADLLDPAAEHGQGTLFLRATLDSLPETRELSESILESATDPIKVVTERQTTEGRRIDISVEIPTSGDPFCLAFENKPYAEDQPDQIIDYLNFLQGEYGSRFLLVYVPPYEREPDESAFPSETRERWRGNFRVLPYSGSDLSLEHWIETCRKLCEAERLNWFLRQAQAFCRLRFGDTSMTSDAETREIREYLLGNPTQLRAALAIHDAWPVIRDEVCEGFLKQLRHRIEPRIKYELPEFASDLEVRCRYGGQKQYSNVLSIALANRPRYAVQFQSHARQGPNYWLWGVTAPQRYKDMTAPQKSICDQVSASLKVGGLSLAIVKDPPWQWPQYEEIPRFRDWDPLTVDLFQECDSGGGPITDYYLDGLADIAKIAIPAIDKSVEFGSPVEGQ